MKKMTGIAGGLLLIAVVFLGQSQCNEQLPHPPFDATGSYDGTWQGQTDENTQTVAACPLQLTLAQNVYANFPARMHVSGTAVIDYSCFDWPEWFPPVPPSTVEVSGLMGEDKHLVLLSGGCGTGFCIVLSLDGQGEDSNNDQLMDEFCGEWKLTFLLAGVQPFGFSGTFEVVRSE